MKWYEIMRRKQGNKRRAFYTRYSKEFNTAVEVNEIIKYLNNQEDGFIYTVRIR